MSTALLGLAGIACAIIALLLLRAVPKITVTIWLVVVFTVPIWVGLHLGPFWSAATLVTILGLATCSNSVELSPIDGIFAAFAVLVIVQYVLGLTSLSGMFIPIAEWFLPYAWGRLVLTRVSMKFLVQAIALVASAVAALAILEWLTSLNYFVQIPPGNQVAFQTWSPLQLRGDFVRVEGAFGHSIALGATLSMCVAFVMAARWHLLIRLTLLSLLAGAVILTLSRIGLVTFVVTLALTILFLPGISRTTRIFTGVASIFAAAAVVPFLSNVFLDAGDEAEGSANYRLNLFVLVQVLRPFGAARDVSGLTVGGDYLGFFARSTDNAFMSMALRVGLVPTFLLMSALLLAVVSILRMRAANAAAIAVAGQIVGLFAVAFITQYTTFFWFVVGLAVTIAVQSRRSRIDGLTARNELVQTSAEVHGTMRGR